MEVYIAENPSFNFAYAFVSISVRAVIPLNQRAVDAIRRHSGSCFDALFVAPPIGAAAASSSAKPAKAKPVRPAPKPAAAAVLASVSTDSPSAASAAPSSTANAAAAAAAATKSTVKAPESAESIAARTPIAADLWVAEWPALVFGGTAQSSSLASTSSSAAAVASAPVAARRQRVEIPGGTDGNGNPTTNVDGNENDNVNSPSAELPANASPYRRLVAAVRALIAPHLSSVLARLRSTNADSTTAAQASGAAASVGSAVEGFSSATAVADAEVYASEAALCAHMLADVPKRWEQLGDVALLPRKSFRSRAWALAFSQDASLNLAAQLWQAVATALRVNRVGRQDEIAPDGVRSSQVVLLHPPRSKTGMGAGVGSGIGSANGSDTGVGSTNGSGTGTGTGTNDAGADDTEVDGWVTHRENGVVFCLDVTRVMFSSGNGTEKQRLVASMLRRQRRAAQWRALTLATSNTEPVAVRAAMTGTASGADTAAAASAVTSAAAATSAESSAAAAVASVDTDASCGETMLDLYTGIGYFSMPALVHTNVAHIHMAEWNPHAVAAIRRNVEANRIAAERYTGMANQLRLSSAHGANSPQIL